MATVRYNIPGKLAWAFHLRVPDESQYGVRWSVDLYPSKEGMEIFKESGIGLRPIKDPFFPGETGFSFRRDVEKMINGKVKQFDPPFIKDVNKKDFEESIGNGSDAILVVDVYDTRKGEGPKGHRLVGVVITDLVPYEKEPVVIGKPVTKGVDLPW